MDYLSKHLAVFPRRFSSAPRLGAVGYLPHKNHIVEHVFETYNFSFVLKGSGFYQLDMVEYEVKSPCVLLQWPGKEMYYGPNPGTEWEEFYLVYSPRQGEILAKQKLFDSQNFIRKLKLTTEIRDAIEKVGDFAQGTGNGANADLIDLAALELIVKSYWASPARVEQKHENAILTIASCIRKNPHQYYDFDQIADELNISLSGFRSYFARYIHSNPGRFLLQQRINLACRLLAETDMPIAEIAQNSGFVDPLYFSRRFRAEINSTPTNYRKKHKIQP